MTVDLVAGTAQDGFGNTDHFTGIQIVQGSGYGDLLMGDGGDNILDGSSPRQPDGTDGVDTLVGGGGSDTLIGGTGFDVAVFDGQPGHIEFDGYGGLVFQFDDQGSLAATSRLDSIEKIVGTGGNDIYDASSGFGPNNSVGFDEFEGRGGDDTIMGSGSTRLDYFDASSGVRVDFTPLDSSMPGAMGTASGDFSVGTDMFDSGVIGVRGSNAGDMFLGSSADEIFGGRGGADTIDGGAGTNSADYFDAPSRVVVDLSANLASDDGYGFQDSLTHIQNVIGSANNDSLTGDSANNLLTGNAGDDVLIGLGGDDTLSGGDGNDILVGGGGNDVLNGGNGFDEANYANASGPVDVQLAFATADEYDAGGSNIVSTDTLTSIEWVVGSGFDDTLSGTTGDDVLRGGDGNDLIFGGDGSDMLEGGGGADTFEYFNPTLDISANELRGPSRPGDIIADFQSGTDKIQIDVGASGFNIAFLSGGDNVLAEGTNFSTILEAYHGDNFGMNASVADGYGGLIYSTVDQTLYYDQDGSQPGYSVVASFQGFAPGTSISDAHLLASDVHALVSG